MSLVAFAFDDIPQIAWTATRDGRIFQLTPQWREYTGLRRAGTSPAALEKAWWSAVHRDDREAARQALVAQMQRSNEFEMELRLHRRDGMDRWFRLVVAPLDGRHGDDAVWLGICTDIDDYKRQGELFAFLAEAGEVLAESLDLQATLNRLLAFIVPDFGDWAAIDLFDDTDRLKTVAAIHADPEKMRLVKRMVGRYTHDRRYEPAIAEALRTRGPMVIRSVNVDLLKKAAAANLFPVIAELGPKSAVTIPLRARGTTIGSLVAYWCETPRQYSDGDLPLFQELTKRAAVSIDHARLYEREREIAAKFQRAALPVSLPQVPGLRFDGIYVPASERELLGGDWYDALRLDDGRIVISVGDVAGSGLPAAVIMASMRQVIRGVAQVYADPIAMLDAADRTLKTEYPDSFVTSFVGVLDPVARTFTHASAGHPPPFLRDASGTVTPLGISGLPLGLRERGDTAFTTLLPESGLIVFYSDGLVEADRNLLHGLERLTAAMARPEIAGGAKVAEAIYRAVLRRGSNDDVVVLTLQFEESRKDALRWDFDSENAPLARATRHAFVEALRTAGIREKQLDAAEHVFGELLGNAARFAPGPVEIILDWNHGAAPVLHVLDRGPGFTFRPKLPTDLLSERGRGLYIVWALAADFNVTPRHDGGSHARAVLGVGMTT